MVNVTTVHPGSMAPATISPILAIRLQVVLEPEVFSTALAISFTAAAAEAFTEVERVGAEEAAALPVAAGGAAVAEAGVGVEEEVGVEKEVGVEEVVIDETGRSNTSGPRPATFLVSPFVEWQTYHTTHVYWTNCVNMLGCVCRVFELGAITGTTRGCSQ